MCFYNQHRQMLSGPWQRRVSGKTESKIDVPHCIIIFDQRECIERSLKRLDGFVNIIYKTIWIIYLSLVKEISLQGVIAISFHY